MTINSSIKKKLEIITKKKQPTNVKSTINRIGTWIIINTLKYLLPCMEYTKNTCVAYLKAIDCFCIHEMQDVYKKLKVDTKL